MKKIIILFMFTLFMVCVYKKEVKALSGNGSSSNPYIVTKGAELKEALSKGTTSWKYIAVTDLTAITETINVTEGKFRIYAKGGNQTIRRSQSMSASVNSATNPLRCVKVDGTSEIEWGYPATSYKLTLDGSKGYFTSRKCNEFFYVGSNALLTIGPNCIFTSAKNTMTTDEASPIRNYGAIEVYGEISYCEGNNGGAVKCINGNFNAFSGSKIHDCKSGTEGGAIYGKNSSLIIIHECEIYNNSAAEEGGGIFADRSELYMYGGYIHSNNAGKTGGGIFSGDRSTFKFGSNGSGPLVTSNYAKKSGGGIRCNGGTEVSGGTTDFDGGTITGNRTEVSGGGISVGNPSSGSDSRIDISNMYIAYNVADSYGGGVCFSPDVKGLRSDEVKMKNTAINNNKSNEGGGAIHLNTTLKMTGDTIRYNRSSLGGGIRVAGEGILRIDSGTIEDNVADTGSGIYQNGIFELSNAGYVDQGNAVYLPKGRRIKITDKLTVSNVLASNIDSEIKTKGTILVEVAYDGGTAESELYYEGSGDEEAAGKKVKKKFETMDNLFLRPSNKNTLMHSSAYIVISEKYVVKYNGNSLDPVANLPENGKAFWAEKYKISDNIVSRIGFVLNINKHWNLSADGTGDVFKPGLDTVIESNITLYAIWDEIIISSLTMTPVDRYYVVGQKITLTSKELTKKVVVKNDLDIDITYEVKVTKIEGAGGRVLATGTDIKTENYINTETGARYKLYLFSSNRDGSVTCTGVMNVNILEDYYDKTEVRFISKEFIDTLDPRSKWNREKRSKLNASLNNEDNYLYTVELDNKDIRQLRMIIRNCRHKISHGLNSSISERVIEQ